MAATIPAVGNQDAWRRVHAAVATLLRCVTMNRVLSCRGTERGVEHEAVEVRGFFFLSTAIFDAPSTGTRHSDDRSGQLDVRRQSSRGGRSSVSALSEDDALWLAALLAPTFGFCEPGPVWRLRLAI